MAQTTTHVSNNHDAIVSLWKKNISVMGDIEQMLHQVNVTTTDRDALRFLWRDNVEHPVEDYIMNVQLFGKKDSLCLANGFLNKQC